MISKGYEKLGVVGSLALTSILFGILHRDIQKFVSTILLGALIGFIVYRTKSIYAGMAAHFTNNTVAVLLTYAAAKMTEKMKDLGVEQVENFDFSNIPTASLVIVIVFYGILFLGFLAGFIGLFYAFYKSTEKNFITASHLTQLLNNSAEDEMEQGEVSDERKKFGLAALISVLPGIILIILTFAGQILELMEVKSGLVYTFLRTFGLS
jgi:hypothetical protein